MCRQEIAAQIVSCLAVSGGEACAAEILATIVAMATTPEQVFECFAP